jgi:catechol 2,3-dioxygenase-like lactoylglutathione lyase family enzyme
MPDLEGIAHIELTVRDPEVSAQWYERVLGFTLRADHRRGSSGVIVMEHGSGMVLGFWQHEQQPNSDVFDEFRTGLDHIAFGVSNRGEIEAWFDHFTSLGVECSEPLEFGPCVVLTFRDPDNVQLEIFWDARRGNPETPREEKDAV